MREENLKNIRTEKFEKKFLVNDSECTVEILDATVADYKGKKEILDEKILANMCKAISQAVAQNTSKYNQVPQLISISHAINNTGENESVSAYNVFTPKYDLDDVALPEETLEQIEVVLSAIKNRNKLVSEWGISGCGIDNRALVLNFFGFPGTGKTMTAEAIAHYLFKQLIQVSYSELESKYVGETPKNIRKVFEDAARLDAVLVFDEADSFLSKRLTNVTQAADYGVNITRSTMLMELERFDGVVVFTTNLIENYDQAFKRRIFANVEFKKPDVNAREKIWNYHLGIKVPLGEGVSSKFLAEKYEDITGADIKDIILYAGLNALSVDHNCIQMEDFDKAFTYVMKRYE